DYGLNLIWILKKKNYGFQPRRGLTGLGWKYDNQSRLEQEPYRLLFNDIYAYLTAWLICSIDNDIDMLMPIEPIGMRFTGHPHPHISNIEAYQKSLSFAEEIFRNGKYRYSIPDKIDDPLGACQSESKLCIEVAEMIGQLKMKLNEFATHVNSDD
ncbi:MAG: hypothetical protein WA939_12285, partial [Nodosilinea sp.]